MLTIKLSVPAAVDSHLPSQSISRCNLKSEVYLVDQSLSNQQAKLYQQYNRDPYPNLPIEQSPQNDLNTLFLHDLITPYYLRHRQILSSADQVILDAGCGSGYTTLTLAMANPGAKVVGVDLSEKSVQIARQRLQHHGIDNVEFHVSSIEDLPQLGLKFDYINCDEVLYLFEPPTIALQALKTVLKPQGIIRANLHSAYQRAELYRAQTLFKAMGLFEHNPEEQEIGCVVQTMQTLRDKVMLKSQTWQETYASDPEGVRMNYLIQGDKGFTVPELFATLQQANLEFISMVQWRHWEITDLFEGGPNKMPDFWKQKLSTSSIQQRLHWFELLHPRHRLLDFWCTRPMPVASRPPLSQWPPSEWQQVRVQLHPQLKKAKIKTELIHAIHNQLPFVLSRYLSVPRATPCVLQVTAAACLLPLWDQAQTLESLVKRWLQIRSADLVTLEPTSEQAAFAEVTKLITWLEMSLYVLVQT